MLPGGCSLLTNTHTVDQSDEQTDDARGQDDDADVPERLHEILSGSVGKLTRLPGDPSAGGRL